MIRSTTLASVLLIGGFVATTGCTDADAPVVILQNQAPQPGCTFSQAPSTDIISRGRIDTESPEGYVFLATVQNFSTTSDNVMESQRIAFVGGADVDHTFQEGFFTDEELATLGDNGIVNFGTTFSGSVFPNGGTATFKMIPIPKELLEAIAPKLADGQVIPVRTVIQIFGDLGGGSFSTQEFSFDVDVCKNCMRVDRGACADLASDFEASQGGNCNELQDIAIDCCTAADSSLTCPAIATQPDPQ